MLRPLLWKHNRSTENQSSLATTAAVTPAAAASSYDVQFRDGTRRQLGGEPPAFTLHVQDAEQLQWFLSTDPFSAAVAFVQGRFEVTGDITAAVRVQHRASEASRRNRAIGAAAALKLWSAAARVWDRLRAPARSCDCSAMFFAQFLDRRMVSSCGYFRHPDDSLERAQLSKLDYVCRKLDLRPGERFLDLGCGWGALVLQATEKYAALAVGCTLSAGEFEYAAAQAASRGLGERVLIRHADYRDIGGRFDKIASIGTAEHLGRGRLRHYFEKASGLLEDSGLFLYQGVARPEFVREGPEALFIDRELFPGRQPARLSEVLRTAELAGLEALEMKDLRPHYALTCRAWLENLRDHQEACLAEVTPETYRTWLVSLAASALNFEYGLLEAQQILFARRSVAHLARHGNDRKAPGSSVRPHILLR